MGMSRCIAIMILVGLVDSSMLANTKTLTVDGGQIAGVVDRGIRVFKGVPYAAPPVGDGHRRRLSCPGAAFAMRQRLARSARKRRIPRAPSTFVLDSDRAKTVSS
jgi:Carboxylesterase family